MKVVRHSYSPIPRILCAIDEFGIGKRDHSVLTEPLVDEPGHPTREALDQVLDFFAERLQVA